MNISYSEKQNWWGKCFRIDIFFSIISAIVYGAIGYYIINTGHLHEDAYILFRYAENVASGYGITYNPGGPPVSGATDFLWMISISFLNLLGLSSAVSAYFLNSIAVGSITFILLRLCWSVKEVGSRVILGAVVVTTVVTSQFASAGLAGFSAPVFTAVAVSAFALYLSSQQYQFAMPVISLAAGLIRPDGLIFGAGFWLLSLIKLRDDKKGIRKFFVYTLACLVVGATYLTFRYLYFGYILPLPLMAKTHVSGSWAYGWLFQATPLPSFALSAAIVGLIVEESDSKRVKEMILAAFPFALHLIALSFAQRSQNVDLRFFAPEFGALLVTCTFLIRYVYSSISRTAWVISILLTATLISAKQLPNTINRVEYLRGYDNQTLSNHAYINVFPHMVKNIIPDDSDIVLTEAGRFPYWSQGKYTDVIGLNSYKFARQLGTVESIQEIKPDLIFYHQAGTFKNLEGDENVLEISTEEVYAKLNQKEWKNVHNPVKRMPIVLTEYIHKSKEYRLIAAKYMGSYNHIYAIRKGSDIKFTKFRSKLTDSYNRKNYMSYLEMINDY